MPLHRLRAPFESFARESGQKLKLIFDKWYKKLSQKLKENYSKEGFLLLYKAIKEACLSKKLELSTDREERIREFWSPFGKIQESSLENTKNQVFKICVGTKNKF